VDTQSRRIGRVLIEQHDYSDSVREGQTGSNTLFVVVVASICTSMKNVAQA
jgi:hypothetical protein